MHKNPGKVIVYKLCDYTINVLYQLNLLYMYSAIIGYADLSSSGLEDTLQRHCQFKRFRGVRHMLNYHPDKPQYSEPSHDNYLTDPTWIKGFGLLEKYNLSFELHILHRQMHRRVISSRMDT